MQKNSVDAMPNKIINNLKKKKAIPQHALCLRAQVATQNPRSLPLALLLSQHQDLGKPIEYQACDYLNIQMHSTISRTKIITKTQRHTMSRKNKHRNLENNFQQSTKQPNQPANKTKPKSM